MVQLILLTVYILSRRRRKRRRRWRRGRCYAGEVHVTLGAYVVRGAGGT